MTEEDVSLIEQELGVELPPAYSSWLLTLPAEFSEAVSNRVWDKIGEVFLSPDPIIQISRSLVDPNWLTGTEWSDWDLTEYVVIGGDGCGNYYIIERDDEDPVVHLLSHDPARIDEDKFPSVGDYCASIDQIIA